MKTLAVTLGIVLAPILAHAHPGHGASGIADGFAHPLTGWDHLLAMLAVGLWAVQLGGRALWWVPATFVAMMTLGSALGTTGVPVPAIEQGVIGSVLILGLLVAAAVRLPMTISAAVVGTFALFHGYAHGAEMPAGASGLTYVAGFVAATVVLHALGIAVGFGAVKANQPRWTQLAGGAVALCAILVTLGWL